ncbi:flagellar protein FlaG [Vibrio hangzhouensis]|uniref:Flagellar protein FlaG n=1 Tax=Vibrio hangzhouensis TaxID=462991 RepID=A0A1H5ZF21_9VIBR|nr:flagellar protein FlaG [Vibrio hangzhouensis]SEG35093.1 flagellar protein FlaG [Vibrio hangzhouensis]
MDISSYASNIQPFASSSGTEIASKNTNKTAPQQNATELDNQSKTVNELKNTERAEFSNQKTADLIQKMATERHDLNEAEREKMVERLDEFLTSMNTGLSFRRDEELGRDIITIYAKDSGEVIRQFPDEELLDVLKRIEQHGSLNIDMLV